MTDPQIIEADVTWTGTAFETGVKVAINADGRIERVGKLDLEPTKRLRGQALLPGMINVHSHAFQRGLCGLGERFPRGSGSFWTWRKAMYELVEKLDAASFYQLCLRAFHEMLNAGITSVGEFHYFHHARGKTDYSFDALVLGAAREAGIRLVLLNAYYNTGGIGQPLSEAQSRFGSVSTEAYWQEMDRLAERLDPQMQSLGVAAHSIRAASLEDIASLHDEAKKRGLVFHTHVEEQRKEIEESLAAYGLTPMALINERLDISNNLTAVHCTHTDPGDMEQFLDAGGTVCVCPLTEANLGDGIPDLQHVHAVGALGHVSLGTDSNARICMTEEMRWLEYGQRLRSETRGVLADTAGHMGRALFEIATLNGAKALGLEAGSIAPGLWADLITVDLDAPALSGCDEETLMDGFVVGAENEVISATCVGGRWVDQR